MAMPCTHPLKRLMLRAIRPPIPKAVRGLLCEKGEQHTGTKLETTHFQRLPNPAWWRTQYINLSSVLLVLMGTPQYFFAWLRNLSDSHSKMAWCYKQEPKREQGCVLFTHVLNGYSWGSLNFSLPRRLPDLRSISLFISSIDLHQDSTCLNKLSKAFSHCLRVVGQIRSRTSSRSMISRRGFSPSALYQVLMPNQGKFPIHPFLKYQIC